MTKPLAADSQLSLPSVDRVLRDPAVRELVDLHGRPAVVSATREVLSELRVGKVAASVSDVAALSRSRLQFEMQPSQRRVFNLTGTVLHTNLGRAPLPQSAVQAAAEALLGPTNLEYDLASGKRGERTEHVRGWLMRLTGAESATVVNNNAAAVFLVLNTLALRQEVLVSRGELIEIGGSFRMPEIMARAGCKLIEVGTTNRTHLADFSAAIGSRAAMLMKVHPSNYAIEGFTSTVGDRELADLAHGHGLPFVMDLGSGALVDLRAFGLPYEPTPSEALKAGADLVTFSGDKLLGGPQAGIIVGRADLVRKLDRSPLKRVLRLDKARLAELEAVLRLYADPDRLPERLPALSLLTRTPGEIRALAERLTQAVAPIVGVVAEVSIEPCKSQIGSGALPVDRLESWCLALRPKRPGGASLSRLAAAFRSLPVPVIGRVDDGCLKFDLRCLEDEATFVGQLAQAKLPV